MKKITYNLMVKDSGPRREQNPTVFHSVLGLIIFSEMNKTFIWSVMKIENHRPLICPAENVQVCSRFIKPSFI